MGTFGQTTQELLILLTEAPSLLKVGAFFVFWLVVWLPLAILVAKLVKYKLFQPIKVEQKLPFLASLYLIAPIIIWGVSRLESVSLSSYGLQLNYQFLFLIIIGFILGVVTLASLFAIQGLFGWLEWRREEDLFSIKNFVSIAKDILLPTLLIGLLVSGIEELIFRGFLLNELEQNYSNWTSAIISSLIFAVLHLVWEQKETLPQLPGLYLMGIVLVLARWVDGGNLGLAIGLHAGWIWTIACIDTANLITYTGKVPELITGILNKPLASVFGIVYLLINAMTFWLIYR